jgi:proteasome lid subunit RPN8/RPN11
MPVGLIIAAADLARIEAEVRRGLPREACGLLIGREEAAGTLHVFDVVPSANKAEGADRFEIDPALLLRLHRELRGGPLQIIGHYHSHPGGSARPSETDRAASHMPGFAWLILAIAEDGAIESAAYLHHRDGPSPPVRLEPLPLTIRR